MTPVKSVLDWSHAAVDVPQGGLHRARTASADERGKIATALGLLEFAEFATDYRIDRLAGGGYRLHGRIVADLAQACVATLAPVAERVTETFDTEFWPTLAPAGGEQDASILDGRDLEVIEDGVIDAGRVIFETLSAGLDPYPRIEGAEFRMPDKAEQSPEKISPFAVLSKLKNKP